MKDAISGNCNEYSEGSPNLLETSEIVLLIVIIGTFKGNFVSFCLLVEFICMLSLMFLKEKCCFDAFAFVLRRKISFWGTDRWKRVRSDFDYAPLVKYNLRANIVQSVETFLGVDDEMVLSCSNALKKGKYFSCLKNWQWCVRSVSPVLLLLMSGGVVHAY